MKLLILTVAFFAVNVAFASSYSWMYVDVVNGGVYGGGLRSYSIYGSVYSGYTYCANTEGPLVGYKDGDAFYMRQLDHKTTSQPVDNNKWIVAYFGELLNEDAFAAIDQIPLSHWYDETETGGQLVSNEKEFYLGFMTVGSNIEDGITRYGWFHVALNDDLEMVVLDSGIGLAGEAVRVGGSFETIPEPTGGVLLVFGAALLVLRRRRGTSCGLRVAGCEF